VLQGLTWPEIENRYPEIARSIRHQWTLPDLPDGETTIELADRVCQAIEGIMSCANDHGTGGCVAVVSHGGAINAYFNRIVGRDDDMPFMFSFGNSSLSIIEVQGGRPRISLVNDMCHLESSAS
jgi:broad specificity phosphatase PhoE